MTLIVCCNYCSSYCHSYVQLACVQQLEEGQQTDGYWGRESRLLIVCKFCCICSGSSCSSCCSCRCCNSNSKQLLKHCCSWRCCCCRSLVVRAKWQLFWRLMIITFLLPLHSALALFPPRCRQVRLPPLGRGILSAACEFLNQKHKRPKSSHIFLASICRARDSFVSYSLTEFFLLEYSSQWGSVGNVELRTFELSIYVEFCLYESLYLKGYEI